MQLLLQYRWPGNVRELQSVVRESLLRSSGSVLLVEFLPPELRQPGDGAEAEAPNDATGFTETDWSALQGLVANWIDHGETNIYRRALAHFDRLLVYHALQQSGGNQARASEILGISRVTLRAKLRATGLVIAKQALAPGP
jgi:two-component system nitrogen regulation response regulator GlnG